VEQVPPAISAVQLVVHAVAAAGHLLSVPQASSCVASVHMVSTRPSSLPPATVPPTHWTHAAAPVATGWPFTPLRHEVPAGQQLAGGAPPEQSPAVGMAGRFPCAVQVTTAIVPGCEVLGGLVGAVPTQTVLPGTQAATQAESLPASVQAPAAQAAWAPHCPVVSQVSMSVVPGWLPMLSVHRWVPGTHTPHTVRGPPDAGSVYCKHLLAAQVVAVADQRPFTHVK
jgi:hypothetical protein